MDILETLKHFIQEEGIYTRQKLAGYYIALNNLYEEVSESELFDLEFTDMHLIEHMQSDYNKEYISLTLKDSNEEYQLFLDWEDVWSGWEDDYSIPRIKMQKVTNVIDYTFIGEESQLRVKEQEYHDFIYKEKEITYDLDELHKEALIEYHEEQLKKLKS